MAEQVSESPLVVLDRIKVNQKLGENMDVPGVLSDIGLFVQMGVTKLPETSKYLKNFGLQKNVRTTLLYRIREGYQRKDTKGVLQDLSIAEAIGMNNIPEVAPYLTYIQTNLKNESEKPAPKKAVVKKPKQRHLKRRLALAAATGLVAFTSLSGSGAPTTKVGLGSSGEQSVSQSDTLSEIEAASEGKEVTASPDFQQLIKPFVEEAMKRRSERAANDPEYYNRVDKELNQDRVNILLYGYGEEWTGGAMDQPTFGSHSIFSINLKTGKIDLVSPTHDTRAPEIEQFLKKNGKEARPTRMDRAYEIGGYDLMRQVLEDATGLSVDYQIRAEDTLVKYLIDNLGGINVDIPFDVNTKQFRDDGKMYPPHQFSKGSQKMDGITALQFIKAWSDPVDPTKERNIRKHLAMKAIFDQVKQKTKEGDRMFGINMFSLLATENLKGNIGFDFDEKQFIFPMLGNLGKLGKLDLSIDKTIFVVDPAIGDGGVQWITANAAENPITQKDIENGVYGQDLAMEIPFNADPYSSNLVRDYWKSVRDLISSRLGKPQQPTVSKPEPAPPVATPPPAATPAPTKTPESTPTPEVKTFKKDIFREQIAPKIYKEVERIRAERAKNDPEYRQRINERLNEGKINFLISGGREDDYLTDTIQVVSYDFASNTAHIISIPRDLQSPEVLKKTKDITHSRINEARGKGGPELLREVVENATGLSVDLYFHANFDVLRDFINQTVKTIDMELNNPIIDNEYPTEDNGYKRIYYPKGINTLTGEQALEVARSRHGSSDYDRAQRQQKIMEAFIKKLLSENIFNQILYLKTIDDIWYQKVAANTLQPNFDLNQMFFSDLLGLIGDSPGILWERTMGGRKISEMPTIFATNISNKNLVVGAGVPGLSITKISGGNAYSPNPRNDYWKTRGFIENFVEKNTGQPPETEEITVEIPAKEQRILYPQELTYEEVKPWIGKLRDSHDAVITESLFTKEIAGFTNEKRQEVMKAIASAHAKALIEHYGDVDAIIGLDPGHGGTDIGSSGTAPGGKVLREKDLTWEISQMIADETYQQSGGKYTTVFLRPENPQDQDLDGDGITSTVERLQKRKAQLLAMEKKLRSNPNGENLIYLSVHFNGDDGNANLKGVETYWPNDIAMANQAHRQSSEKLAKLLQQYILSAIRETGYSPVDRGAKKDPDERQPLANSETRTGPYVALGSPKLDRYLRTS